MLRRLVIFSLSVLLLQTLSGGAKERHLFEIGETEFLLDGRPFLIRCGELHFARIPRPYWRHRLKMCRAMGLNAVCAYLFWNNHERQPGTYDFEGSRDVAAFCRMAQEEGLWVLLRPGPYVCAEWEFGGLPWWLLKDGESGVKVRTRDQKFLEPAKRYLMRVGRELAPLQVTRGGPILMVQVENEYGSYGNDSEYIQALAVATRAAGFDVRLFSCNGRRQLQNGRIPELFEVVNFGGDPEGAFSLLRQCRRTGPLVNGEYYPGWFDSWGESHHAKPDGKILEEVGWMLEHRASFSIYMAHGGTSFGWWAGCNTPYKPQTSSYDYAAPISESGDATDKFFGLRSLCERHLNEGEMLPPVPAAIPRQGFVATGTVAAASLAGLRSRSVEKPTTFERLGLGYGVAVFSRELPTEARGVLSCADVRDHAAVFVDDDLVGFLDRRYPDAGVEIARNLKTRTLKLVVAAMGRFNFGHEGLEHAAKGIAADIMLSGVPLRGGWRVQTWSYEDVGRGIGLDFGIERSMDKVRFAPASVLRFRFDAKSGRDTWLDTNGWPFGIAWINGQPLGRYWAIGPTRTMFVPGCWLRDGQNELVVWDLKGLPPVKELVFMDHPVLDELHPELDLSDFARIKRLGGHDSAAEQIDTNLGN